MSGCLQSNVYSVTEHGREEPRIRRLYTTCFRMYLSHSLQPTDEADASVYTANFQSLDGTLKILTIRSVRRRQAVVNLNYIDCLECVTLCLVQVNTPDLGLPSRQDPFHTRSTLPVRALYSVGVIGLKVPMPAPDGRSSA